MLKPCLKQLAALLVLLIAVQAIMPRELVWCCQGDGDISLELGHHGRCLGLADPGCSGQRHRSSHNADSLRADTHGACEDIAVAAADGRSQRWERMPAPAPVIVASVPLPLPAMLQLCSISPRRSPEPPWRAASQRCLSSVLLRI